MIYNTLMNSLITMHTVFLGILNSTFSDFFSAFDGQESAKSVFLENKE